MHDELVLHFIEQSLYLVPLGPRGPEFDVLSETCINRENAKAWQTPPWHAGTRFCAQDVQALAAPSRRPFTPRSRMFPLMMNEMVSEMIEQYKDQALGWKLSGRGRRRLPDPGMRLRRLKNAIRIIIRRKSD